MSATTPIAVKKIKFQCKQCKFDLNRVDKDLNNPCPKCHAAAPYVSPDAAAKNEAHKTLMSPNSKAVRTSTAVCPKAPNGEHHTYALGSCKFCKKAEGAIEDKPHTLGATAYPGGKSDCSSGGKHMFAFSKCKKCGLSELEYTKQNRAAAPTTPSRVTTAPTPKVATTPTARVSTTAAVTPKAAGPVATTPRVTATPKTGSIVAPKPAATTTPSKPVATAVRPTATTPSKSTAPATPVKPTTTTTPVKPVAVATPLSVKKTKFQCKQCKFDLNRVDKDLNNPCPKCHAAAPYVSPDAAAKNEAHKTLMSPNSKAVRTSTAVCPKAPNGEHHTYALGSCKFCKKAEGAIEDKPHTLGATAYPGGKSDCSSGGKHMFAFSKCKKCGLSELEYTKQNRVSITATAKKA
jgi:Zn finger protein HypA/HybF involved in hydrogenase expression